MAQINISDDLKKQAQELNIDISAFAEEQIEREIAKRHILKIIESDEDKELERWSVELGREAKKGRFKQLLKEVSPEIKEKLLSKLSSQEKEKYLSDETSIGQ